MLNENTSPRIAVMLSMLGFFCNADIDECKNNACGKNAICTDTDGSYECECKAGYMGNPKRGCIGMSYSAYEMASQ